MRFSFIAAKPKYLLSRIVKIWLLYIGCSLFLMIGFGLILQIQTAQYMRKHSNIITEQGVYEDKIQEVKAEQERVGYEIGIAKEIVMDNTSIKNTVDNILSLIPDQITISLIEIQKDSLTIKGYTPSKEVFRYMLQNPLRAVFGHSDASFYMLSNGGYEFVSRSNMTISSGYMK